MAEVISPIVLSPGEGQPVPTSAGSLVMKAEAAETSGALGCYVLELPPGGASRLHRHPRHDETKYVLEGEVEIRAGERVVRGGPGTFAFIPRGTPHTHRNVGPGVARIFDIFTPGGFEGWFGAVAATTEPEERAGLNERYGIEVLGPR